MVNFQFNPIRFQTHKLQEYKLVEPAFKGKKSSYYAKKRERIYNKIISRFYVIYFDIRLILRISDIHKAISLPPTTSPVFLLSSLPPLSYCQKLTGAPLHWSFPRSQRNPISSKGRQLFFPKPVHYGTRQSSPSPHIRIRAFHKNHENFPSPVDGKTHHWNGF